MEKDQYLQEILNKTESVKEDLVIKDIRKLVKNAMKNTVSPPTDKRGLEKDSIVDYFQNEKGDYTITHYAEPIAICGTEAEAVKLKNSYSALTMRISVLEKMVSAPTDKSQEEQGWISVKERLPEATPDKIFPELSDGVLTYDDSGNISICHYNWKEKYWEDEYENCPISHWMPLPKPPVKINQ